MDKLLLQLFSTLLNYKSSAGGNLNQTVIIITGENHSY